MTNFVCDVVHSRPKVTVSSDQNEDHIRSSFSTYEDHICFRCLLMDMASILLALFTKTVDINEKNDAAGYNQRSGLTESSVLAQKASRFLLVQLMSPFSPKNRTVISE